MLEILVLIDRFAFWVSFFCLVLKILTKGVRSYCDANLPGVPVMDCIKMVMGNQVLHIASGPKIKLAPTRSGLLCWVLVVLYSSVEQILLLKNKADRRKLVSEETFQKKLSS